MGLDRLAWVWHGFLARVWTCVRVSIPAKPTVATRQAVGLDIRFLYDGRIPHAHALPRFLGPEPPQLGSRR
eukprot:175764-Lingulodinium_polyedra.AAC.1